MNAPFDPGRRWSIPYTWLVLGVGYRKSKVDGVPDSWKWLMDSDRYKGRIGLFSEADDMVELGAKYLGHSVRNIPAGRGEAVWRRCMCANKPNIKHLPRRQRAGSACSPATSIIVMEYNGDIAQVMAEDPGPRLRGAARGQHHQFGRHVHPQGRAPAPERARLHRLPARRQGRAPAIYDTIKYPTPNAAALRPDARRAIGTTR